MAERDELLDHNYDGIQEYDNDLPNWWVWLFILTVVFGVAYTGYLHFGPGLNQEEQLALDMEAHSALRAKVEAAKPKPASMRTQLISLTTNDEALEKGKKVYMTHCVACHLPQGQGSVGPNLTDDYWIHGGDITDIHNIIVTGVVAKGMLAWKGVISDEEIAAVSAYVWNLHGTNPPNPKAAQGELVPRDSLPGTS